MYIKSVQKVITILLMNSAKNILEPNADHSIRSFCSPTHTFFPFLFETE